MTEKDIFNNTFKLRNSFISELILLLENKINYDKIMQLYQKYILYFNINHNNYLNIFVPKIKSLKHKSIKNKRIFLCFIYDLVSNIHNAFISSLENKIDISKFFLGFSIYDLKNLDTVDKLKTSFKNKESYDIDLLELTSIYDKIDASIIIEYKLIDIYLLQKLSNYNCKIDLIELIKEIHYIDNTYHDCNKIIIDLIIRLLTFL